jgi:uracil-DNA glycosylase
MSDQDPAIDYVQNALRTLQGRGVKLTAARASLQALVETAAASAANPVPPKPASRGEDLPRRMDTATTPAERPRAGVPVLPKLPPLPRFAPTLSASTAGTSGKAAKLAELRDTALACVKCEQLVKSRHGVVFGVGNPEAELMFVGEAPGEDEDLQGEPFVGAAGQLLTKIIETMGFTREQVYIANVLKCRPNMPPGKSGNRKPTPQEMEICLDYLKQQIDIIRPRVLVGLGATALQGLAGLIDPMGSLRGRWHDFNGIPLMATYHPAYLLRNQSLSEKRKVWEDMLMVLEKLGRPISEKQRAYFLAK